MATVPRKIFAGPRLKKFMDAPRPRIILRCVVPFHQQLTAFGLADSGDIAHGALSAGVDHIKELQTRLAGNGASDDSDSGASSDE